MRVLVLGATGYVGGAVLDRLVERGHDVVAALRPGSDSVLPLRTRHSVTVVRGEASDPSSLATVARSLALDAVVHAAAVGAMDVDRRLVEELAAALDAHVPGAAADEPKTLLYTSGVWVLGPSQGQPSTETSEADPIALVAGRDVVERAVLGHPRVRGIVVRPGIVHGHSRGIPELLVTWARQQGIGRYVAARDGSVPSWPMVHVGDLADLMVLALERRSTRGLLHGVTEPAVPASEVAAAAAAAAGVAPGARPWAFDEAAEALGEPFAEALALSQHVHAPGARATGWEPARPTAVDGLRARSPYPVRTGSPPAVSGPNPHAQVSQVAPRGLQDELASRVLSLDGVRVAESLVSVPGARAFVLDPDLAHGPASAFQAGHEFAHLHPPHDGSLHVALPPEVADRLYAAGWGEPHPRSGTPLIYGPRDRDELDVVTAALHASYAYARGWARTTVRALGTQRATA